MLRRPKALLARLAAVALSVGACATSTPIDTGGGSGGGATSPITGGTCRLYDCDDDAECATCAGGKTRCSFELRRCVSCRVDGDCPGGLACSAFGACVPLGAECPVDGFGEPEVSCSSSADCVACDPLRQVCEPSSARCVTCTPEDTGACAQDDQCIDNRCAGLCPGSCVADNDCAQCSAGGQGARACNEGLCAQCSPTYACPAGQMCSPSGICIAAAGGGGGGGGSGSGCAHDLCVEGAPLDAGCDACTADLCVADPYCCDTAWDAQCVQEVVSMCFIGC